MWKRVRKNVLGHWLSLYYFRGYSRIAIPLSLISNVITVVGIIDLLYGKGAIAFFWISSGLICVFLLTASLLFGHWDFSNNGARIYETAKALESDGAVITIYGDIYPLLHQIADKLDIPISQDYKDRELFFVKKKRELC